MRLTNTRRVLGSLLAILALAAGTAYAASPDESSAPPLGKSHERTIDLVETSAVPQPAFIDLDKPGLSAGDHVVIRDGVTRPDGSSPGVLRQECTLIEPGSNPLTSTYECTASIALPEGTIILQGPFVPAEPEQAAAVTGGTGAFRGAQGEASVRGEADQITIHLAR